MILKCKQKMEFECVAYDGTNFTDLIPFMQDSKNFVSAYIEKEQALTIGLNVTKNQTRYKCNFPMVVGDFIIKHPNKEIIIVTKKEFEEQYDIINEDDNQ